MKLLVCIMSPGNYVRNAVIALLMVVLCSCENPGRRDLVAGSQFDSFRESQKSFVSKSRWWDFFEDEELGRYIRRGLRNNFDIRISKLSIKKGRLIALETRADVFPSLDLELDYSYQHENRDWTRNLEVGIEGAYEVDFWGRVSASKEQSRWNSYAVRASANLIANEVIKNIAKSRIILVSNYQKKRVLIAQKTRLQKAFEAVDRRYKHGRADRSDVVNQKRLLESVETSLVYASKNINEALKLLELLLGASIDRSEMLSGNMNFPTYKKLSISVPPSSELYNRPNIRRAYYNVESANYAVGEALANRYPVFSLGVGGYSDTENISDLLDGFVSGVLANIVSSLFDGGRHKSIVQRKEVDLDVAILKFKREWLDTIASIRASIRNQELLYQGLLSTERQLLLAKEAESLKSIRYENGSVSYSQYNRAQEISLDLEVKVISLREDFLISQIEMLSDISLSEVINDNYFM